MSLQTGQLEVLIHSHLKGDFKVPVGCPLYDLRLLNSVQLAVQVAF